MRILCIEIDVRNANLKNFQNLKATGYNSKKVSLDKLINQTVLFKTENTGI